MSAKKSTWLAVSAPVVLAMFGYLVGAGASDANAQAASTASSGVTIPLGSSSGSTAVTPPKGSGYYGEKSEGKHESEDEDDYSFHAVEHVKKFLGVSKKK
jgi:hypothetical protein